MAFDWKEYIDLAETLNNGSPTEAQMRCATSRVYYGVFCLCRNKKNLSANRRPDIHNIVINLYKDSDNKCEYSIGQYLDGLRKNRNNADYDGLHRPTVQATTVDINNAKSILNILNKIDSNSSDCD